MQRFIVLILSLVIVFFSCDGNMTKEDQNNKVTITGQITHPKSQNLTVSYTLDFMSNKDSVVASDSLDKNQSFNVSFDLDNSTFMKFRTGKEYTNMYLSPGDSIHITLDGEAFDSTISFTGTGAIVNSYLAQKMKNNLGVMEEINLFYKLDQSSFLSAMENEHATKINRLRSSGITDSSFLNLEEDNLIYSLGSKLLLYDRYNAYATKRDSNITLIASLKDKIESIDRNNPKALNNASYINFLGNYLSVQTAAMEDSNKWDLPNRLGYVDHFFTNNTVKEFMKASEIYQELKYGGPGEDVQTSIAEFSKSYPNSTHRMTIDKVSAKWAHLVPGKKAPEFAYRDVKGDTLALKDLLGKIVYIDVWATWCGPCKQEAPHFQKLAEDFAGKDVVFLGVSIDSKEDAWVKYLEKKKPTSTQIIADNDWKSSICKEYNINGIPRFILIGRDGNIINANAERPSGDIRTQLEGLLSAG